MKKRIFILLSSILCVLVTISLVTYTLVGIFSNKKEGTPTTEETPVVDTTVDTGENEELTSDTLTLFMIVGDAYTGEILTSANYTGTLLTAGLDGQLIATVAGTENISVQVESVVYACAITVYEKGDGSAENPYNIIRAEDLIQLVEAKNGEYAYYAQRCDLDLSSYDSWVSIGTLTNPFVGSYNGNGYAIKNMNIVVTPENANNYIDNAQKVGGTNATMLTIGFFGMVGDPNGNEISEIKDLSVYEAKINTSAIETEEQLVAIKLDQSYVGVLAGYTAYTNVIGGDASVITSDITSSLYCDDTYTTRGAVSAFIGGSHYSILEGFSIKSNITAKNPGTVTENNGEYTYNGTTIVGILGRNIYTSVNNFDVELSVNARNYENMCIAGGIGYILNYGEDLGISDININNLYVNLSAYSYTSNKTGIVAGAVVANQNPNCYIQNVAVNNIIVNAIGTAQVSGIIDLNKGHIQDATVTGIMKGSYVAGVANTNKGEIVWTDSLETIHAVDVNLKGQVKVAGVAIYNEGTIAGAVNLTQIKAVMSWSIVRKNFDQIAENIMIVGVAVENNGDNAKLSNLYTLTNIIDAVNASGVVGIMNGGSIENVDVNTTIRTVSGNVGSTTYSGKSNVIAGVVAYASETTNAKNIVNVCGNITINNPDVINEEIPYGLNVFGSIVGVAKSDVTISNSDATNTIQVKLFTNASSAETQYIGTLVGFASANVTVDENVKVEIAIIKTAENAIVNSINK